MTSHTATARSRTISDRWVRRGCALVVAAVAAYSSYAHQRDFALTGGADHISASLWPLSVDGLVILASLGLVKSRQGLAVRGKLALWGAFLLGIALSLVANIAAAPSPTWQSVLVAGWPPLALLLAVELVVHTPKLDYPTESTQTDETTRVPETPAVTESPSSLSPTRRLRQARSTKPNAESIMWAHYETERKAGRTPTGAELDRIAGTSNYGRAVLARWRTTGRIPITEPQRESA